MEELNIFNQEERGDRWKPLLTCSYNAMVSFKLRDTSAEGKITVNHVSYKKTDEGYLLKLELDPDIKISAGQGKLSIDYIIMNDGGAHRHSLEKSFDEIRDNQLIVKMAGLSLLSFRFRFRLCGGLGDGFVEFDDLYFRLWLFLAFFWGFLAEAALSSS